MQNQNSPSSAAKPVSIVAPSAGPSKPKYDLTKFVVPALVVLAVCTMVGVSSQKWDRWTAMADVQSTNNAYVRAEFSRLSARVGGNVISVGVSDFDRVKKGDLIVQIDPEDFRAKRDQAKAALASALAQLDNLENQEALQRAAIQQAEAQASVARANANLAETEAARQQALIGKGAGIQQKLDEANAQTLTTAAALGAANASVQSAKAQLDYVSGQREQLGANVQAARASLTSAEISLSHTTIVAPIDGVVSELQVRIGDYVTTGTSVLSIVPLPKVHIIANFKETQLARMQEGQPVAVEIDSLPGKQFVGHVTRLSPASGSQFALLPADNATGNFTKVVQRIPVKIDFDPTPELEGLRPGMSAVVSVTVNR